MLSPRTPTRTSTLVLCLLRVIVVIHIPVGSLTTIRSDTAIAYNYLKGESSRLYPLFVQILASDVTLWTDGGGKVRGAATRSLHGPAAVARFMIAVSQRYIQARFTTQITQVNGEPAILMRVDGHLFVVVSVTIAQQHILEIRAIGNPEKLRHLE